MPRRTPPKPVSLGALLSLALAAVVSPATAAPEQARVQVEVHDCARSLDAVRLEAAIIVELRNLDPELVAYIEESEPRVVIDCDPDATNVRVTTRRGEALDETLQASEAGTARFIAIAIVESLAAQAATGEPEPEPERPAEVLPSVEPEPSPLPLPAPPPKLERYPLWWGRLGAGARLFGEPSLASAAGRIGVERATEAVSLSLDLEGSFGSANVASGKLQAATLSSGFSIHRRAGRGRVVVMPGVGVRAGGVRWHGSPTNRATTRGRSGLGFWAGPFADLFLGLDVTSGTRVDLAIEGGFTPVPVKATENSNVIGSLGELWLTLGLGLAVRL